MANITNFLGELRRRNVFKVGVAYGIVAWLIIQIASTAFPALHLPPWAITLVTVFIIIGFPLILLFAWAFELTPAGFKPAHHVVLDESITHITGRKFDFAIIGLMAFVIIYLVLDNYVWVEDASPPIVTTTTDTKTKDRVEPAVIANRKSVAVLPFTNRSEEKKDAYFADGLHDDLLSHLSKISDLKVISRTSVMGYRKTQKNMRTIGEELGVATIMEGGVQRAGNQVRINVQLIDAETDEHLWAEIYDRELTTANIFAIQSEIATAIANALRATLSPEEQERLAVVPTGNLAAYEAYLLGNLRMAKRSDKNLAEAVDYFQQVIDLDPGFALAYVGLSDAYQLQIDYSGLPKDEMNALAEVTINKSLALDDQSGEAYASLAYLKYKRSDYDGAEVAFKKALTLNPNYATIYNWYGELLGDLGRDKEGRAQLQKALSLDPLSIVVNWLVANHRARFGRFDAAIRQFEKVIEIDPAHFSGYWGKGRVYWFAYGRLDEAASWLRKAASLDPENPGTNAFLGGLYLDLGDDKQAECWLNHADKQSPESLFSNFFMSFLHVHRNAYEQALPYARKALKERSVYWASLDILPDHDLIAGTYDEARAHYEKIHPELLTGNEATIDRINYKTAIDLAYVLQLSGEQKRAELLLESSLAFVRNSMSRLGFYGYGIADVRIYAMQGEKHKALTTLRQAIDEGWRTYWWYYMEHDSRLESIRNEPEFQAMLAEIKTDMAEQLARVKEMEKEGDVCVNP